MYRVWVNGITGLGHEVSDTNMIFVVWGFIGSRVHRVQGLGRPCLRRSLQACHIPSGWKAHENQAPSRTQSKSNAPYDPRA